MTEVENAVEPISTYYGLLRRTHELLRPERYLEIGVHEGHSLAFVQPGTRTLAVDPEPKVESPPAGTTIVSATSDSLFTDHDVQAILGGPVDFAFIDGLHLFEQTLRDFINVEANMAPDGVVFIHDCFPIDEPTAARERTTVAWSGDVWKVIVGLTRHRPDLTVATAMVEPTGMGIVTGLNPNDTSLSDNFDAIVAELMALTYADLEADRHAMLNTVAADWTEISTRIRPISR